MNTHRRIARILGLGALCAFSVGAAYPATFAYISNENATIDSGTWHLSQTLNGITTVYLSEHGLGEPTRPGFSAGNYRGGQSLAITMNAHPNEYAPDGNRRDRNEYVLMNENNANTLRFNGSPRYSSFAFFVSSASSTPNPDNCIIYQAWQGSPLSPIIYLSMDPDGELHLYYRNDATGGNALVVPSEELWADTMTPGQWHTIVIYQRLSYTGNGQIALWWNGTKVVDVNSISVGYKPQSLGGIAGALDGCRVKFGMYQGRPNTFHKYFFDEIKFTTTYAEAVP